MGRVVFLTRCKDTVKISTLQEKMENISTIKERILTFIEKRGVKKADFYLNTGVSDSNFKGKNKNSQPGGDVLVKILTFYPELNGDWLLTGKGDMLKNETTLPAQNATCAVSSVGKETREISTSQLKKADNSTKGIPLIPLHAMAGVLRGEISVLEYECEQYVVPAFKGADFLIPVKGNSMFPTYQSGDIVACQRTPMSSVFFQWNKPYVLDTAQGAIIKRIRPGVDDEHVQIVSDNTDYLPFYLHKSEIYAVALVVGIIRLE